MTGIQAINTLARMGFRAWVEGQEICLQHEAPGNPDPGLVQPLVALVKEHKAEVLAHLKGQANPYCRECPQYLPRQIHPDGEAWCLWHQDTLTEDNPSCQDYRNGRVPMETVCCTRCGGVIFTPDYDGNSLCLACDWEELTRLYPGLGQQHDLG